MNTRIKERLAALRAAMAKEGLAACYIPTADYHLSVEDPDGLLARIPQNLQRGLLEALSQDPRPAYQDDPDRVYTMAFAGLEVKFTVSQQKLTICMVVPSEM